MGRTATPALSITLERARAHWHRRQGLAEPGKGSLEELVAATSWPRTLGGVDVYLAVRARVPSLRRQELDEAVTQSRLQVIPAVRGCIYLVPRAQVPLMLRFAEDQARKRSEKELEKVGVPLSEVADVGEAVLKALRKGPLMTDALRKALPEGVVRSLGEKGKKVGMSSTLPSALRHLDDGERLVGFWEYDPSAEAIVFNTFDPLPPKRKRAAQELAENLATFLEDDVGHARSFSLDTMEAVQERANLVKKM